MNGAAEKKIARAARTREEVGMPVILETRVVRRAGLRPAAAFAAAEPQGQFSSGQAEKIFDGTNTLVVDPCTGADETVSPALIRRRTRSWLAGTSAKKIYICSIHVVVAAATSVALVEGTGSVCATGTAGVSGFGGATAATGWNFVANGGIALGNGDAAVGAEGTSGGQSVSVIIPGRDKFPAASAMWWNEDCGGTGFSLCGVLRNQIKNAQAEACATRICAGRFNSVFAMVVALLVVLLALPAGATTYYVAAAGSDANSGTSMRRALADDCESECVDVFRGRFDSV